MSRKNHSYMDSSRENTSKFLMSVSLGHEEGLKSLENEIKMRVSQSKYKANSSKQQKSQEEEKHLSEWKRNMNTARARKVIDMNVTEKRQKDEFNRTSSFLMKTRNTLLSDIDDFESKFNSTVHTETGINIDMFRETGGTVGSGIPAIVYLNANYLKEGLVQTQESLKKHHDTVVERQQANERRRGRFIREFEFSDCLDANHSAEEEVLSQLFVKSAAEVLEQEKTDRIRKKKTVCYENHLNREARVKVLQDVMTAHIQEDNRVSRDIEVDEVAPLKVLSQLSRIESRTASATAAVSRGVVEEVTSIIDRVLDAAVWVVSYQEAAGFRTRDVDLPPALYDDAFALYSSPLRDIKALPFPLFKELANPGSKNQAFIDYGILLEITKAAGAADAKAAGAALVTTAVQATVDIEMFDQSENFQTIASASSLRLAESIGQTPIENVAVVECKEDYIDLLAPQLPEKLKAESQVALVPPAFAFNTQIQNLLGEIVVTLRNTATPIPNVPPPQVITCKEQKNVLLLGASNLARKAVARHLASVYGLYVLSVREIISDAVATDEALSALLCRGDAVPDAAVISLIVQQLARMQDSIGKGFVIEDFPNTAEEACLLLESLSGVNYTSFAPHPSDKASMYASVTPFNRLRFDAEMCGIKALFDLVVDRDTVITSNVSSRIDMESSETIYLTKDVSSLQLLTEQFTPGESKFTFGVEVDSRQRLRGSMDILLADTHLVHSICVNTDGTLTDESALIITDVLGAFVDEMDIQTVSLTLDDGSNAIIADSSLIESSTVDPPSQDESTAVPGEPVTEHSLGSMESRSSIVAEAVESVAAQPVTHVTAPCPVPQRLAEVLSSLWTQVEAQSLASSESFFSALKEIRLISVVRRRLANDALHSFFIRPDQNNALVGHFIDEYNAFDYDFRYDTDFKSELCLRALELRDALFLIAKQRKSKAEDAMSQVAGDGMVAVYLHRVHSEGAALLQAELNRFIVALHLILDFTKAVCGRFATDRYNNDLEETLRGEFDAEQSTAGKGGKDKGKDSKELKAKETRKPKKGEVADPVPYRESVPKVVVSPKITELPVMAAAPEEDKKSKASAAKAKKAAKEEVSGNPFEQCEHDVRELVKLWSKDTYKVNRALYRNQESLCSVAENAVWYEHERLLYAINAVKDIVNQEATWIEASEAKRIENVADDIASVYALELSSADCAMSMLVSSIEKSELISSLWQVASDAIVVEPCTYIVPTPEDPPDPEIVSFFPDHLNAQQLDVMGTLVKSLAVNGGIYEEDASTLLRNIEGGNHSKAHITGDFELVKLALPSKWVSPTFPDAFLANGNAGGSSWSVPELLKSLEQYRG